MRKVLVIVMVLMLVCSGAVLAADGYFNAKLGLDFSGVQEFSSGGNFDIDNGFTIAGEYLVPYSDTVDFGAGLAYQFARGINESGVPNDVEFNFTSLYGLARYKMEKAYLVGQLGFNLFDGSDAYKGGAELEGGLYYGFGAGMDLSEKMFGEILYSVNNGIEVEGTSVNVRNSQISLMLGYTF